MDDIDKLKPATCQRCGCKMWPTSLITEHLRRHVALDRSNGGDGNVKKCRTHGDYIFLGYGCPKCAIVRRNRRIIKTNKKPSMSSTGVEKTATIHNGRYGARRR